MTASINPTVTYKNVDSKPIGFGKAQIETQSNSASTSKTIAVCSAASNDSEANLFQKSAETIYNSSKAAFSKKLTYSQWASFQFGGYSSELKTLQKAADQDACKQLANDKAKLELEGGK